jgi:hypothetical protein
VPNKTNIQPLNFWRGLILLYYIPIGVTLLITRFVLLSILLSILFIGTLFRIPVTGMQVLNCHFVSFTYLNAYRPSISSKNM